MVNTKYLVDITREVLNHSDGEYLRSDFTGWCEGACAIVDYILKNYTKETDFRIIRGKFDGQPHNWIVLNDGQILDPTVDQFGDEYSIYSSKLYKGLYQAEGECEDLLMFDDWVEYINILFEDGSRVIVD